MLPQHYYQSNPHLPLQSFQRPMGHNGMNGVQRHYGAPVSMGHNFHHHQQQYCVPMGALPPRNMNHNVGSFYHPRAPAQYGGPNMADSVWMRRPSNALLSSQHGSFCNRGSMYGSFYAPNGFDPPAPNRQYNGYSGPRQEQRVTNSFGVSDNFGRKSSNLSEISFYGANNRSNPPSLNSSTHSLNRNVSGLDFNYSYGAPQFASKNSSKNFPIEPQERNGVGLAANATGEGGMLMRHNSITLKRANSATNGFYEFGPEARNMKAMEEAKRLSQSRLTGRLSAPPHWQGNPGEGQMRQRQLSTGNGRRSGRPVEPPLAQNPVVNPSSGGGDLTRKGSEKRIGMYFKDLQPTQEGGYKKEGDPGTGRGARAIDPSMMTHVRTVLLLSQVGGRHIEVDGNTAIFHKPSTDELQKFDTNELVSVSLESTSVFIESLDELRDTFLMGCNIGIVMADSGCPAHVPSRWFTWNAVKQLAKDTFAKMSSRSEFTMSVSLLEDDQVMDLLSDQPAFTTLTVAQSPLFGNVPHGMIYEVVESASEFGQVLDGALSKARGQKGEERGIVLLSAILKQIRTDTPHTKGDEEDIVLSSLFASGVGDGIIHYNRILDKNPAEPRAMFQFALGGPSMTAAVISIMDGPSNDATVSHFLSTLSRLGEIQNYRLRLGSVRRFIGYTKESIPQTSKQLQTMPDGREKAAAERSLARLELMLSDAESMLQSPDTAVPKAYIRNY